MARGVPQWDYQSPINNPDYCSNRKRFSFTKQEASELFSILRTNGFDIYHVDRVTFVTEIEDAIDLYVYQLDEARNVAAQNNQAETLTDLIQTLDDTEFKLSGEMGGLRHKLGCYAEIDTAVQALKKISISAKGLNLPEGVQTKSAAKRNAQQRMATILLFILSGYFGEVPENGFRKILEWCYSHKPEAKAYKINELISGAYSNFQPG